MTGEMVPFQPAPGALITWAQDADAAYKLAERLITTAFSPAAYKGKPAEAAAAILAGAEVGLSPLAALRSFDVIQGVAAPRALTLRAVALARGCEIVTVEESATRCIMKGRRTSAHEWETVTWTIDDAKRLGLATKDNWIKQPGAMLVARATSTLCRRIAADAILGLGYSLEELSDEPTTTTTSRGTKTTTRAAKTEPETTPPTTDEQTTKEPPAASGSIHMISPLQIAKAMILFEELGMGGKDSRDQRISYTRELLGLPGLESSTELTKDQGSRLIDLLETVVHPDVEPPAEGSTK